MRTRNKKAAIERSLSRRRNAPAKALEEGQFQPQTVSPKKGKGSYTRKDKHKDDE